MPGEAALQVNVTITNPEVLIAAKDLDEIVKALNARVNAYDGWLVVVGGKWAFVNATVSGWHIRPEDSCATASEAFLRALDFLIAKSAGGG